MSEEETRLAKEAERYVKAEKRFLIETFANEKIYKPVAQPVSLFMAGSPGVGKTEFSKRLIEQFKPEPQAVRIDADEIREWLPGYAGSNAYVFQCACTLGVNKLHDHVLKKKLNMILDGTFTYAKPLENIKRSLKRGRKVEIYYLYQDPEIAWAFTKKREKIERRKVSREFFRDAFFASRENVNQVKAHFKSSVILNLVIQNFNTGLEELKLNIDSIDPYMSKRYTLRELEDILR